jgi:DNA adenine methylase
VPWSTSANFATYSEDGFSYKDQHELAQAAFDAATRGATVVVSNHFTPITQKLYVETFDAEPHVIDVQRYISSKTDSRESVKEIIAVFKPR